MLLSFMIACVRPQATAPTTARPLATVVSVEVSGDPGAYRFAVGVDSDDTGCEQYVDWWEVVREDGSLAYRRILAHSHVGDEPFVRAGGPVPIRATERVYVRPHLAPLGYGAAMAGSITDGFTASTTPAPWADLALEDPLPTSCAF